MGQSQLNTHQGDAVEQINSRLDKIDKKLDEVGKAMISLARTEERVSIMLEQNAVLFKQVAAAREASDKLKDRVHKLETENATQGQSIGFFERIGWAGVAFIGSIIGAIVGWVLK